MGCRTVNGGQWPDAALLWLLMRAWYRVRQFGRAFLAPLAPADSATQAAIRAHLPGDMWHLFAAMAPSDQRHGLLVLRALEARGFQDPPLMQAALLHDCAKHSGRVGLWYRVAVVLLRHSGRVGWNGGVKRRLLRAGTGATRFGRITIIRALAPRWRRPQAATRGLCC